MKTMAWVRKAAALALAAGLPARDAVAAGAAATPVRPMVPMSVLALRFSPGTAAASRVPVEVALAAPVDRSGGPRPNHLRRRAALSGTAAHRLRAGQGLAIAAGSVRRVLSFIWNVGSGLARLAAGAWVPEPQEPFFRLQAEAILLASRPEAGLVLAPEAPTAPLRARPAVDRASGVSKEARAERSLASAKSETGTSIPAGPGASVPAEPGALKADNPRLAPMPWLSELTDRGPATNGFQPMTIKRVASWANALWQTPQQGPSPAAPSESERTEILFESSERQAQAGAGNGAQGGAAPAASQPARRARRALFGPGSGPAFNAQNAAQSRGAIFSAPAAQAMTGGQAQGAAPMVMGQASGLSGSGNGAGLAVAIQAIFGRDIRQEPGRGAPDAAAQDLLARIARTPIVRVERISRGGGQAGEEQRPLVRLTFADGTTQVIEDPLVFDLKGGGIGTSRAAVRFDMDGDGKDELVSDVSAGNGVLAFDRDRDGVAGADGRELFGNNTDLDGDGRPDGYRDGFEALKALAAKAAAEGVLDGPAVADKELGAADLARLEDAYGLRMKLGGMRGPAVSLAKAGVAAIALCDDAAERTGDFDGRGNDISRQAGAAFTRSDGSSGSYAQIWFGRQLLRAREWISGGFISPRRGARAEAPAGATTHRS